MAQKPVSPELVSPRSSEDERDKQKQSCDRLRISRTNPPFISTLDHRKEGEHDTDPRHRTGATGVIEDPHGPPGSRAGGADALLVGAVVLLEPFDANQAPARLEPPGYLGRCLLVLCIVVCCFIAEVVSGSAFAHVIELDQRASEDYLGGEL